MNLKTKLEEMRKRCEAATPGPWSAHENTGVRYVSNGKDGKFSKFDNRICEAPINLFLRGSDKDSNMNFIAASRTDMPALIDALEVCLQALEYINTHELYHGVNQGMPSEQTSKEALVRVKGILGNASS